VTVESAEPGQDPRKLRPARRAIRRTTASGTPRVARVRPRREVVAQPSGGRREHESSPVRGTVARRPRARSSPDSGVGHVANATTSRTTVAPGASRRAAATDHLHRPQLVDARTGRTPRGKDRRQRSCAKTCLPDPCARLASVFERALDRSRRQSGIGPQRIVGDAGSRLQGGTGRFATPTSSRPLDPAAQRPEGPDAISREAPGQRIRSTLSPSTTADGGVQSVRQNGIAADSPASHVVGDDERRRAGRIHITADRLDGRSRRSSGSATSHARVPELQATGRMSSTWRCSPSHL